MRVPPEFWQTIKWFKPQEFGISTHGPEVREREAMDNMNPVLIEKLDELRSKTERAIIIHAGFAVSGHSKNSWHYFGDAADLDIQDMQVFDQYQAAREIGFGGYGLYPHWDNPGLHLDVRPLKANGDPTLWVCNERGIYIYWPSEQAIELLDSLWMASETAKGGHHAPA